MAVTMMHFIAIKYPFNYLNYQPFDTVSQSVQVSTQQFHGTVSKITKSEIVIRQPTVSSREKSHSQDDSLHLQSGLEFLLHLHAYIALVVVVECIYKPYVFSHSVATSSAECN